MPPNPVAPGPAGTNLLNLPGVSAVFHGNFDRTGETEETDDETDRRILRPGAILLANLNINHAIDPGKARSDQLDALDTVVANDRDAREMATLKVVPPAYANQHADKVVLHIHPDDARRVHLFQSGTTHPVYLGTGKADQPHETITAGRDFQYELPPASGKIQVHFEVEALTLAGSPLSPEPRSADDPLNPPALTATPAPVLAADLPPTPAPPTFEVYLPSAPTTAVVPAPTTTTPVYDKRLPGEIWFQLVHLDHAGAALPAASNVRDAALYTIAPYMLLSNLRPAEIVYIVENLFNADTVADVERAMGGISGVKLRKIQLEELSDADPADPWVQDEFEIGYCWAVHNWMHVALHCLRERGLAKFVRESLPDDTMGLFDDLPDKGNPPDESISYGGNLELSPPVKTPTDALKDPNGGPDVPAHPRAPFGKVLIGTTGVRPTDPFFLQFLQMQRVQPILPLNTSWLAVGHVDEFMCFVPSTSATGFKLVMASSSVATKLLEAMKALNDSDPTAHPLTDMHRGRSWSEPYPPTGPRSDDAMSVEDCLDTHRTFNDMTIDPILLALEKRLKDGCKLNDDDVIRVPIYFNAAKAGHTAAFTPGLANLQVVNRHVLVPRPFGARMNLADAGSILRDTMGLSTATDTRLRPFLQSEYWAFKDESSVEISIFFADGGVSSHNIEKANPGKFDSAGLLIPDMTRVLIPEQTIDLFEAYTQILLEDAGLTVHMVDDWHTYHRAEGEIHCGTNVKRRPPELDAGPGFEFWWDYYAEIVK